MSEVKRIAMWSGPRNISTAFMRSWGSREDTVVWDEPFYAHYLKQTGVDHPGRDEVLQHHETDCGTVIEKLLALLPAGKSICYQKHMAHHLLPGMDTSWMTRVSHCFLIRAPREVITSFIKVVPEINLSDTGLPQQLRIFRHTCDQLGEAPPVLDSADVLSNPEGMLRALCARLGVEFVQEMLAWEAGPRATDGVWAKYWYDKVEQSTGFGPYQPKYEEVPHRLRDLLERCEEIHAELSEHRLTV